MFYICGVSGCPHICTPLYVHMLPIHLYAPRAVHTPHMPPYSSMPLCVFWKLWHVVGGCNGFHFVLGHPPLHHPCLGVPPLHYTPTLSHWFPAHQYVSGILVCYVGHFPSARKGLGVFSHQLGGWGHQHLRCPYAHPCTFFVVHYVSCFDYGSDYYSSNYSGIFWPFFCVISDSSSFPDRVSSKLGSAWHGSTTNLDAKRLWRYSWLSFLCHSSNLHLQCLP